MKIVDTSKSNNCGHGDGKKFNAHECTLIHVVFDSCFSFCLLVATASVTQRDVSFGEDLLMFRCFAPFFRIYHRRSPCSDSDEIGDTNAVGRIFQHCWIDREEKYDPRTDGSWGLPSGND